MDLVAYAQIGSAVATVVLALMAFSQVREMRAARIEQQRPHVIVDADYGHRDVVSVVVRNIGAGAAKDVSFEFSAPLESTLKDPEDRSKRFVVSELPYLKEGMDYLAPGAEIRSGWDTYINLLDELAEKGPREGVTVTSRYRDLSGRSYTTPWKINPLKVEGALDFPGPVEKALRDLTKEVRNIGKKLPPQ